MKTRTMGRRLGVTFMVALVLATLVAAPAALGSHGADTAGVAQTTQVERKVIVEVGDPVVIAPRDRVQTVVSIGGDVKIAGTVDESVVVIGGDLLLQASADVGGKMATQDATIVIINGELTRQAGAEVNGNVETIDIGNLGDVWSWASENGGWKALDPFATFIGWLVCTVAFLLLGLLAAAIMPGQIRAVERQVATRPGASLGWGALIVLLIVPMSVVLLAITIIGLIPVAGIAIVLPFFTFFVVTSVATFVVERLLGTQLKGNLMGAVAIGVIATSTVVQIPFFGFLVLLAMIFIGTGAAVLAWNSSRLERRALRDGAGPDGGLGGTPQGTPPAGPAPAGAPLVQGGAPTAIAPAAVVPTAVAPTAVAPTADAQTALTQVPGTATPPPAFWQPPYAQTVVGQAPLAPPPLGQAPVGTQAYLHPQYGWLIYPPPVDVQAVTEAQVATPATPVPAAEVVADAGARDAAADASDEAEADAADASAPGVADDSDAGADPETIPHHEVK
jgi:hypothetical protein